MALKAGIVGLPNVGKSTLFNCLSSAKAQAANFPFCTIDAQMGQVSVPDERLTKLAELVHPGRIVPWATSASATPSFTCCAASTTATSSTWTVR